MRAVEHRGLSSDEARTHLLHAGPNEIFRPVPVRFWAIAREEVTEPIILLLLVVGAAYSFWV